MERPNCSVLLLMAFQPVSREAKWIQRVMPKSSGEMISYVDGEARIALAWMPAL